MIAGKYAVVRVLGQGGMGVVYEASHVRLRQRVAIKMVLPEMLQQPVLVSRFEREARAAAQLRGRHVARVMDVDTTPDGLPYMIMEFLEGRDLQSEIDERGALPFDEAVDYLLQACAAMGEAHVAGIVHRDLKPSNLFLADDGGQRVVKVLDFGISKVHSDKDAKLTDTNVVMGTALYMSPEQVKATADVDARTDIWSLGVILYETITGRAPWNGSATQVAAAIVSEDAPDVRSFCNVPPELAIAVHTTLQRDPARRFPDVRRLAAALAPFAPVGSIGRAWAESVVGLESGQYARVALRPPSSDRIVSTGVASAPTEMSLPPSPPGSQRSPASARDAVSEARMHDGTTPGWTEGDRARKSKGLLVGAGVAFVAVLVVTVAVVFAVGSLRSAARAKTTAAAPSASTAPSAASVPDEPLPPSLDPPPPSTAAAPPASAASASSVPVATATPRTPIARPKAPPAHAPTPSSTGAAPKPPAPKASNAPADKPLFL